MLLCHTTCNHKSWEENNSFSSPLTFRSTSKVVTTPNTRNMEPIFSTTNWNYLNWSQNYSAAARRVKQTIPCYQMALIYIINPLPLSRFGQWWSLLYMQCTSTDTSSVERSISILSRMTSATTGYNYTHIVWLYFYWHLELNVQRKKMFQRKTLVHLVLAWHALTNWETILKAIAGCLTVIFYQV